MVSTIGPNIPFIPAGAALTGAGASPALFACATHADDAASTFMMAPPGESHGSGFGGGRLPPAGGGSGDGGDGGKRRGGVVRIQGTVIPVWTLASALGISREEARDFIDARREFFEVEVRVYRAMPRDESFESFFERQLEHSLTPYHHRLAALRLERETWFQQYLSQQDEEARPVVTMLAADLMIAGDLIERDGCGVVTSHGRRDLQKAIEGLMDLDANALGVGKRWLAHRLRSAPWSPPPTMFLSGIQAFLPPGRRISAFERYFWLHALRTWCAIHWRFFAG